MQKIIIIFLLSFFSLPTYAYLGPGMGLGIIAATLGIIIAIIAAIFGIIWFPIKRLLKNRNKKTNEQK